MIGYKAKLAELGIVESRIDDLFTAMDTLHRAVCKLDNQQLSIFNQTGGFLGHMDIFAREEGIRNVAIEFYEMALRKAAKQIDFDEFPEFSDKLFYLTEQANEVKIPGAQTLCKALCDLRKRYESKRLFFGRLAFKMENITEVNGHASEYSLQIRNTNRYVDSCKHMDDWTRIGDLRVLHSIARKGDSDSGNNLMFVKTKLDSIFVTTEDLKKAISATLSHRGCSHEHDCCGCVSQSVGRIKKLTNRPDSEDVWAVQIHWYRNV